MSSTPGLDLKRDAILFGDLRNLDKLKDIQNPTEDDVRGHAAAVRRLLLDGELPAAAGRRYTKLLFHPPDSLPLVRAARNERVVSFFLGGVSVFGVAIAGAVAQAGPLTPAEGFHPDRTVDLELKSFLKQVVGMSRDVMLSRHDVILYVANKIGGIHMDANASGHLTEEKMRALGRFRREVRMGLKDGMPTIEFSMQSLEEEQGSKFRYEPEFIDAVYLEFLACVEAVLGSLEVQALRTAIAADLVIKVC